MERQQFDRCDFVSAKNVDVKNIKYPINLNDDVSLFDVQVIDISVNDIDILIYPGEDLDPLKKIIESKKKNTFPPLGIDYFAANMVDIVGYKINGAAITEITAEGAFGGLLLEIPRAKREYFFPAEVPHSIGVAVIKDADIFVKRKLYETYVEDLKMREKEKHEKVENEFGMYV